MSFKTFLASKRIISEPKLIAAFFHNNGFDPLPAFKLHVYEESYFIIENENGTFIVPQPVDDFKGTLSECEKVLYEWDHE